MHDIKFIRENPDAFTRALKRRPAIENPEGLTAKLLELDTQRRKEITELQELQAKRNDVAKQIPMAKKEGKDVAPLIEEGNRIKQRIAELEATHSEGGELEDALMRIPNLLADDVPNGADENANQEIRIWGKKPEVANAKEHFDLGEALGMMDFETATKISGSRFVLLSGHLARLERALANFMLDIHTHEFGYTECNPPLLVKDKALYGTGQLPKFEEDLFSAQSVSHDVVGELTQNFVEKFSVINPSDPKNIEKIRNSIKVVLTFGRGAAAANRKWLIPTAEVSLTNIVADSIIEESYLPRRYTAWTPCFRSEAGSAGKDTRGMIRQHQFSKVELVSITKPEDSVAEHERMTNAAETILQKLGLHYRVMLLCAGDTGFGARKTYDIEVWLPGQNRFREISSCSNCGDFQARRMKARYRKSGEKSPVLVHTLNGSGLAVGRTLVAILENYQQPDGSIKVPDALVTYMGGLTKIEAA
ncbi:MAG: serine--tRNA ligase [Alphaproteobacteria bacterium]|nr:serine--tRNA ligase [Alphaproteobacteria bacterium]